MRRLLALTFSILFILMALNAEASSFVSVEGAWAWQTRNDQAIPGSSGTRFSLSDIKGGPFSAFRAYAGYAWDQHEIRVLYAPLSVDLDTSFNSPVSFMGKSFAANTPTSAFYKFNSYRVTYTYFLQPAGEWKWGWGFTGKIRDAEVRLSQAGLSESKTNVGFVPLLNLRASRSLGTDWAFRFDMDGLAAPQGRAFDIALLFERKISQTNLTAFGGYRTVEGGADNDEVYNFAWFHYLTLGLRGDF